MVIECSVPRHSIAQLAAHWYAARACFHCSRCSCWTAALCSVIASIAARSARSRRDSGVSPPSPAPAPSSSAGSSPFSLLLALWLASLRESAVRPLRRKTKACRRTHKTTANISQSAGTARWEQAELL
jgi:hypothetical protein